MLTDDHKDAIRALYQKVSDSIPGFRKRSGQREMVAHIGRTLGAASDGGGANFLAIEGRTGVGKTVGYLVPALIMGPALKKKVVFSTGTVALQEQLFLRDLPAVLSCMDKKPSVALLKGRGRFVCTVRLGQLAGNAGQEGLFAEAATWDRRPEDKDIRWLRKVAVDYDEGRWNGEIDTLSAPAPGDMWQRVQNSRHTCPGRKCDSYHQCSYFKSLAEVRAADVIVCNHDLVLSCLSAESKLLPSPSETYYVFDEAHHLPSVAVNRDAMEASTTARRWIERVPHAYARVFAAIPTLAGGSAIADLSKSIADTLSELEASLRHNAVLQQKGTIRFPNGQLDANFQSTAKRLFNVAADLVKQLDIVEAGIDAAKEASPTLAASLEKVMTDAGFAAARVAGFMAAMERFAAEGTADDPLAKWVSVDSGKGGGYVMNVSPIFAGPSLRALLWGQAAGAVLTSATLTTLGNFEFFLRDAGLDAYPQVVSVAVASPFDYQTQGSIVVPRMTSDPAHAENHTNELISLLPPHLDEMKAGTLVLFTSKRQMQAVFAGLPALLAGDVLMQGSQSRAQLIAAHIERVNAGRRSILFGLASFGEGLDLPGSLAEQVLISKLPFSPPDSPIEEARAEWIEARGGNSFMEITLPKAGLMLIQWVGRLIRTESDVGRVVLFDPRIRTKRYGRQLLDGLPPFRRVMA